MAVYTKVSKEDLANFVAEYDIGTVISCNGITEGVENSNFLLQTNHSTFILTLYERRVQPGDLPFFLSLMEHLAHAGITCPVPLRGRDGCMLRTLCGKPAAIVTFLDGVWPRQVMPIHCRALGEILAKLHLAGKNYPGFRPNTLSVNSWRPLFNTESKRVNHLMSGLDKEIKHELDNLENLWPTALPEGLIHADLFPDNVFFQENHVTGIIDFYFACNDFLAYDIAVCLNAWCFEIDGTFNAKKACWLLSAYKDIRPLSEVEEEALPILVRGAAMRFLLTRLYDWLNTPVDALVRPKNPLEYVYKMRFHQSMTR